VNSVAPGRAAPLVCLSRLRQEFHHPSRCTMIITVKSPCRTFPFQESSGSVARSSSTRCELAAALGSSRCACGPLRGLGAAGGVGQCALLQMLRRARRAAQCACLRQAALSAGRGGEIARSGQNPSGVMCLARWASERVMSLACELREGGGEGWVRGRSTPTTSHSVACRGTHTPLGRYRSSFVRRRPLVQWAQATECSSVLLLLYAVCCSCNLSNPCVFAPPRYSFWCFVAPSHKLHTPTHTEPLALQGLKCCSLP